MLQDSVPAGSYNDPFLSSVWHICTDVKLLLIYIYKRGVTGVPGGSVTNEDTSPGPVKTYPQDYGGAPGRI